VVSSSVNGRLVIPRPVDLLIHFTDAHLTSTGEVVGPRLELPPELPLAWWRVAVTPASALLSRSYLRLQGGTLRFVVDPQYGPEELAPLGLQLVDIGADGQIQAARTAVAGSFVGLPFAIAAEDAIAFATWTDLPPTASQALVTLPGTLSFPEIGGKAASLEHGATGAAVTLADDSYARGNPDLIRITGNLAWTNGFAKGRSYKEFLGLAKIDLLKAATLSGMVSVGLDGQGVYERYGLGLSADAEKLVDIYQSGGVSIATKLGAGVVSVATGGQGRAAEVGALVSSFTDLTTGKFATQAAMDSKLFQTLSAALKLAKGIHLDAGGAEGDEVSTALDLGGAGLAIASGLVKDKKTLNYRETAVLILTGLDAAFPILARSSIAKDKPDALAILGFTRLGIKATRFWLDSPDGLKDKQWFSLSRGLFEAARPLSPDPTYVLVMDVLTGVFQTAEGATGFDDVLAMKIAGGALASVRKAGVVKSNDWNNALAMAQALVDGAVAVKDLPSPDRWITLASMVLMAAGGDQVHYGAADDLRVKQVARLAARTLQAITAATGGIPYEKAAAAVKDAYDTEAQADNYAPSGTDEVATAQTIRRLVDYWSRVKGMVLADAKAELELILCDAAGGTSCATPAGFDALVTGALADAKAGSTPASQAAALRRLADMGYSYSADGTPLSARVKDLVAPGVAAIRAKAIDLTIRIIIPGITAAQTFEEAGRLYDAGTAISYQADQVNTALSLASPDLNLDVVVDAPVKAAMTSWLSVTGAGKILTRLASTSALADVVQIWTEWKPRADSTLASSDPGAQRVAAAFDVKVAELRRKCGNDVLNQLVAPLPVLMECINGLALLPGPKDAVIELAIFAAGGPFGGIALASSYIASGGVAADDKLGAAWALVMASAAVGVPEAMAAAGGGVGVTASLPDTLPTLTANITTQPPNCSAAVPGDTKAEDLVDLLLADLRASKRDGARAFWYAAMSQCASNYGPAFQAKLDAARRLLEGPCDMQIGGFEIDLLRTNPGDAVYGASSVVFCSTLPGRANSRLEARVPGWIAQAKAAPCSKRLYNRGWLWSIAPWVPSKYPDIKRGIEDLDTGCVAPSVDPKGQVASIARAGGEIKAELDSIVQSSIPDEDKKEALAWFIARRVQTLTAGFKGDLPEEKVLRAVNRQTGFVLDNRQKTRIQRVAAVARLLADSLADLPGVQLPSLARFVPILEKSFTDFEQAGGEALPPWPRALSLAASLANTAIPDSVPQARVLVGSWLGLLKTLDPATQTGSVVALAAVPVAVAGGVALGVGNRIRVGANGQLDVTASFAAMGMDGEPWSSIGVLAPEVADLVTAAGDAQKIIKALRALTAGTATVKDRLAALRDFVGKAPKLGKVGGLASAFIDPVPHLKPPDTDQGEFTANLLLAELGEARGLVPGADAKPAESTCPSVTAPGATLATGTNDTLLCIIDMARRVVRGLLAQTIVNPNPLDQVNAQAAAELAAIRQAAIFAPLAGDENLSGLSGGLEYRAGVFKTFQLYGSFNLKNTLDAAVLLDYDNQQSSLTLRLASVDPRPADALSRFGLVPGSNRILGTDLIPMPLRLLEINVDGHRGCFDGKAVLGITSPFGGWETGEAALGLCWKPFTFALSATINYGMFPPWKVVPTLSLCASETGGAALDLDVKAGIDVPNLFPEPVVVDGWGRGPYLKSWGLYGMLGLGLGFSAGPSGVELRGRGSAEVGVSVTEKDEPNCLGVPLALGALFPGDAFEPRSSYASRGGTIRYGICRSGFGAQAEFRAGAATLGGFYLKSQTAVDLGIAKIGFWTYSGSQTNEQGAGTFPANRHGGWPSVSASPLSPGGLCGVTP
jgi:hypothetical protein